MKFSDLVFYYRYVWHSIFKISETKSVSIIAGNLCMSNPQSHLENPYSYRSYEIAVKENDAVQGDVIGYMTPSEIEIFINSELFKEMKI